MWQTLLTITIVIPLLFSNATAGSDDFNCPKICGKGPNVIMMGQHYCKAYDEEGYCTAKQKEKESKFEKSRRKKKSRSGQTRLVGGQNSDEYIPWMVLINIIGENGNSGTCGGSLINSRFVLTAAHCICGEPISGVSLCERPMKSIAKEPNKVRKGIKLAEHIRVYVGKGGAPSGGYDKIIHQNEKKTIFVGEKAFIHPELGTNEKFPLTPDLLLIKLDRYIEYFDHKIKPLCLAGRPTTKDIPPCWDNTFGIEGGCGTVAGWGKRQDQDQGLSCVTDASLAAPAKATKCMETSYQVKYWEEGEVKKKKIGPNKCTKMNILAKQMSKKCHLFFKELKFMRHNNIKVKMHENQTYHELVRKNPIMIQFKKKGKYRIVQCGKIKFDQERQSDTWGGWCPVKLSINGNIKKYGFCPKSCEPDAGKEIQKLNVNILTELECEAVVKNETNFDKENEFCAGKKHQTPAKEYLFKRATKNDKRKQKEKTYYGDDKPNAPEPTKYTYKRKAGKRSSLFLGDGYKYDWFLGGGDSCQGDSGGPLWRIVDIEGGKRAVQIGVVARGEKCAGFNTPGIYTKTKNYFDWIKKTVEKEGDTKKFCPSS